MELNASVDAKKMRVFVAPMKTSQSWLSKMCPVKSLIRLHKCAGRSKSSLGAHV